MKSVNFNSEKNYMNENINDKTENINKLENINFNDILFESDNGFVNSVKISNKGV